MGEPGPDWQKRCALPDAMRVERLLNQ
jgi:hypothetical protein